MKSMGIRPDQAWHPSQDLFGVEAVVGAGHPHMSRKGAYPQVRAGPRRLNDAIFGPGCFKGS